MTSKNPDAINNAKLLHIEESITSLVDDAGLIKILDVVLILREIVDQKIRPIEDEHCDLFKDCSVAIEVLEAASSGLDLNYDESVPVKQSHIVRSEQLNKFVLYAKQAETDNDG